MRSGSCRTRPGASSRRDLLKSGAAESAAPRRVHAKVYRFFSQSPRYEALFVGSVNLTGAAHSEGGNFETAFLVRAGTEDGLRTGGCPWSERGRRVR